MSKQDIEQDVSAEDATTALDALIQQQEISPVSNLDELSDLWPANDDPDLFLRHVLEERAERRRLPSERESVQ
jgi:hypothetical protein